jgi:hypothetical protein
MRHKLRERVILKYDTVHVGSRLMLEGPYGVTAIMLALGIRALEAG